MNDPDNIITSPRPSPIQQFGAITWPSFFAAAVAAAVFFAIVDPGQLFATRFPGLQLSRELGYAIGFFLLWLATASSCTVTWLLLRPMTVSEEETPLG